MERTHGAPMYDAIPEVNEFILMQKRMAAHVGDYINYRNPQEVQRFLGIAEKMLDKLKEKAIMIQPGITSHERTARTLQRLVGVAEQRRKEIGFDPFK